MIHPWLESLWNQSRKRLEAGALPHALLLTGPKGLGKGDFARHLAARALCQAPGPDGACGQCKSCTLMQAGTHPDFFQLEPEEAGKQIRIDAVRGLIEFMNLSCHYGTYKVAIIEPADAMNTASANSLLKTLEEPPAGALLILVSAQPSRLPVTIRSRCQRIRVQPPSPNKATPWLTEQLGGDSGRAQALLAIAHGAPLYALELEQGEHMQQRKALFHDLLEVLRGRLAVTVFSGRYQNQLSRQTLEWVLGWLEDLIRLCSVGESARLGNPDLAQDLRRLAKVLDLTTIFELQEKLYDYMRFHGTVNLNSQMVLEDILINWQSALRVSKR